jgi:hypothetical protein
VNQRERIETPILVDQAQGGATAPAVEEREHIFSRVDGSD